MVAGRVRVPAPSLPQQCGILNKKERTKMEKRSKTNKEIYEQKYPHEEVLHNPILCAEAIGYLKALKEYFPSEEKWVEIEMSLLMLVVVAHAI